MSKHECPSCGHPNKGIVGTTIICVKCQHLYYAVSGEELVMARRVPVFKTQVPDIEVGEIVFVVNAQHVKHLEPGKVIRKAHGYYHVEFNDKIAVWLPSHWIEKSPF